MNLNATVSFSQFSDIELFSNQRRWSELMTILIRHSNKEQLAREWPQLLQFPRLAASEMKETALFPIGIQATEYFY